MVSTAVSAMCYTMFLVVDKWLNEGITCFHLQPVLEAVSLKPWKLFVPVKPLQNLEHCDYRAVLFTNISKDEGRFPSYNKFQVYTLPCF